MLNVIPQIKVLLADRYGGINTKEFRSFLEDKGIQLIFTAVDCPFSKGLNERLNQTLVIRMRCRREENKVVSWSTIADKCIEEYNNTVHTVTRFLPKYLINGLQDCVVAKEVLKADPSLDQDRKIAFKNSQKNHNQNKKYFTIRVDHWLILK